jgi:hypothetical protein
MEMNNNCRSPHTGANNSMEWINTKQQNYLFKKHNNELNISHFNWSWHKDGSKNWNSFVIPYNHNLNLIYFQDKCLNIKYQGMGGSL